MNDIFGLSMTYIAAGCLVVTAAILALIAFIAIRNPVMFKMGLRNIPRRKAQTTLIIIGLMLSTLIITAAFGTGDTLTSSITSQIYEMAGEADEYITWDTEKEAAPADQQVIPLARVDELRQQFAGDEDVQAFLPFLTEQLPVQNTRTRLNEPAARIVAFRPADTEALGGLKDLSGRPVTLGPGELAVNKELAEEIDAAVGDQVLAFYQGTPVPLTVTAIVPNQVLGGSFQFRQVQGGATNFEFLSELTARGENADGVFVSNRGGVRSGLDRSDAATAKLEAALEGEPYRVEAFKKDGIEMAEFFGNILLTFFIVLGLFSIAAGVLLIFLIFVMLAAERKPEMGMARAVGAKRRQLVESFLAEGLGYDLGSAVVGLVAGIGVTFVMMAILESAAADEIGLDMSVTFAARSLIVSFCLGLIATFIVIFVSSWRASRLNIVAAIRDLPETRPLNPERATWLGYSRAILNGVVAGGITATSLLAALRFPGQAPLFLLAALVGLPGPWLGMLRGHNFGAPAADRKSGERAPAWPFILGVCTLPFGLLVIMGYALALLLVRITRDRKPESMPGWLLPAGIAIAPLGVVLSALQTRGRAVAWSVGFGTVGAVMGALMVQWGLEANQMFLFAGGVSLIFFWVAATLRYFHIHERLTFTVVSAWLLALWYLVPGKKLDWLVGPLEGDIEMFFLSGVAMVTCGVFIVVYNADIILPVVEKLGSRFGRIMPAMKTAVAYPLTSRFRTGMTMAMIGLIMFALVVNSTLNSNFERIFLSEESRGGWDVQLMVNPNNPITGLRATVAGAGVDTAPIAAVGENRIAYGWEAEVENRDGFENDDGEVKEFSRLTVIGADRDYFLNTEISLKARAAGYPNDRAAWEALAEGGALAILPASVTTEPEGFGGPGEFTDVLRLKPLQDGFEPFTLGLRDPGSGNIVTVTVIGQAKEAGEIFWNGMFVPLETHKEAYPDAKGQAFYLSLGPGVGSRQYARTLEAALVTASAESLQKVLDDQQATSNAFMLVFQGFMGLGLIVGIAALGVVASRAVVERRQQIGMLRAIGYKRGMVALSFLFESGFVAASGVLLGLLLGVSLSWVLFTSGSVGEESKNAGFTVPWLNLAGVSALAFGASMLMTFLPARSASRVPIAEALRYE